MDTSVFPGQPAAWTCEVQSTIPLQFTWYLNNVLVLDDNGSHMATAASSMYTLYNVNYTDNNSTVRCSAAGSRLMVNSSDVSLTGKSLWLTFRPLQQEYNVTHTCIYVHSLQWLVVYKYMCMYIYHFSDYKL